MNSNKKEAALASPRNSTGILNSVRKHEDRFPVLLFRVEWLNLLVSFGSVSSNSFPIWECLNLGARTVFRFGTARKPKAAGGVPHF